MATLRSSLVDPVTGRPIEYERLEVEESGPTLAGLRQVISDHPWQGMTPLRLGRVLRAAEQGDADAYLEVAEELEEKDLHYRSVLSTRKLQVSQLPIMVEAASDDAADQEDADFVREHLVDSGVIGDYLFDMLDGIGKGFSVGEIIWSTEDGLWIPQRIEHRDPRWFEFDRRDGRTLLLKGGAEGVGVAEPLKPFGYVRHTHKTKSGLPIRGGLAFAACWLILFKVFDVKAWVEFLEGFGQPVRLGKYKPGASKEDKATLLRAVRGMWKDSAAIIPDGMAIEWLEAKVNGNVTLQQAFADWADRQVSKLVLGQTGTTDVGQHVGTANAHERVREDIEKDDGRQSAGTAQRDLVRPLVDLNKGPRKRYPRLKIERPDAEDVTALVDSVVRLVPLGLRVEASVMRDKLGLPDPPKGEDVEVLRAPAPPAPVSDPPPAEPAPDLATQSQQPVVDAGDALDELAQAALEDWQAGMAPLVDPIQVLAEECGSADEFAARLPEILEKMDATTLVRSLAQSCFAARAAGEVEAEID